MGLLEYFGTLGMLFAYGLGLAPIPSLWQGIKDKEITNITIIYLLSAVSNCSLWSLYSLKKGDYYLLITNGVLLALFLIYLGVFLYIKKEEFIRIGGYYGVIVLANLLIYNIIPTEVIGFAAFVVNTVWGLCAIENLRECLKRKDPKLINIQISVVSVLCGFSWFSYGVLSSNFFVIVPNLVGIILWGANIICYYWSNEKIPDESLVIVTLKKIVFFNQPEFQHHATGKDVMSDYLTDANNDNFGANYSRKVDGNRLLDDFKTTGKGNDRNNF